jgi:ATP-dependent Clp protease adaptor protein ClpS
MKNEVNKEYTTQWEVTVEQEIKEPSLYHVLLHNDDFTPMEFVVSVLEMFFFLDRRKASSLMIEAHIQGKALCGIFSKDFAESKTSQVVEYARLHEHPLVCSMEAQS